MEDTVEIYGTFDLIDNSTQNRKALRVSRWSLMEALAESANFGTQQISVNVAAARVPIICDDDHLMTKRGA